MCYYTLVVCAMEATQAFNYKSSRMAECACFAVISVSVKRVYTVNIPHPGIESGILDRKSVE